MTKHSFVYNMNNYTTVFVAREYMLTDDFGGIRIDEEAVFPSFELAKDFLKSLEDENAADNDLILFRTEIVEYQIGSIDGNKRKWTYKINGEIIEELAQSSDISEADQHKCTNKYKVGDIVYILPKVTIKYSPSVKGTHGVIVQVPSMQSKQNDELKYIINYITENGIIGHFHVLEEAITTPEGALPNKLIFLDFYSKYLKKRSKLNNNLVSEVINEEVFVKNIKKFDFSKEKIIE